MITDHESPHDDSWGHPVDHNYECEFCGRSMEARFGGIPGYECDSCSADFHRVMEQSGGLIEFVEEDV